MNMQEEMILKNWTSIEMESPKGVTLGEWYRNLPKAKAIGMKSVIFQHLGENLPLTEEALLKTSEEISLDIARRLGNL